MKYVAVNRDGGIPALFINFAILGLYLLLTVLGIRETLYKATWNAKIHSENDT